jgi:hypothetical protein
MVRKKAQARVVVKKTVDGVIKTVSPAKKVVQAMVKAKVKAKDKEGRNDRTNI